MSLDFMLAKELNFKQNKMPKNWYLSEKFDGYRARYEPDKGFYSRNNNQFSAPSWFTDLIPDGISLDGELWCGHETFELMSQIKKKKLDEKFWEKVKYMVYDLPDSDLIFSERLKELKKNVNEGEEKWKKQKLSKKNKYPIIFVEQHMIESKKHFNNLYENIIKNKGEGIILKNPSSYYENSRSDNMLKVKPVFDKEALIIDYRETVDSKLKDFVCVPIINVNNEYLVDYNEESEFIINGLSDDIKKNYKYSHPIGTIITYLYSGVTKNGKPRFARYHRIRDDIIINS